MRGHRFLFGSMGMCLHAKNIGGIVEDAWLRGGGQISNADAEGNNVVKRTETAELHTTGVHETGRGRKGSSAIRRN